MQIKSARKRRIRTRDEFDALRDIARAKDMTDVARAAGLGRESLYKALSPDGNPEFAMGLKVVRSLGLKLHASAG